MKKVLVTSTYFTTDTLIGSVRIRSFCKYLPEYGWEPIVLSPQIPGVPALPRDEIKILEYPDVYARLKRPLLGGVSSRELTDAAEKVRFRRRLFAPLLKLANYCLIPDYSILWWRPGVRAAMREIERRGLKFDAIFSSSNPKGPHFIAHSLKKKLGTPWVAEFRDYWTLDHYYPYGNMRHMLEQQLEKKIVGFADALISVSQPYADRFHTLIPRRPAYAVSLGFDPDEWPKTSTLLTKKFTITYTGGLAGGKRNPVPLLEATAELIREGVINRNDIEIRFFGNSEEWLNEAIARYELGTVAAQHGYIPRQEALDRQRESQLLLILLWDHPLEEGVLTGKLEYLASQRPIMVVGGPSRCVWQDLIRETNVGAYLRGVAETKSFLMSAYQEWKTKGSVTFLGDRKALMRYSYRKLAGELAHILDSVARK